MLLNRSLQEKHLAPFKDKFPVIWYKNRIGDIFLGRVRKITLTSELTINFQRLVRVHEGSINLLRKHQKRWHSVSGSRVRNYQIVFETPVVTAEEKDSITLKCPPDEEIKISLKEEDISLERELANESEMVHS